MNKLPYEIMLIIVDKCNFLSKIRLTSINKKFNKRVYIYDLINVPIIYILRLDDEILKQKKLAYPFLIKNE